MDTQNKKAVYTIVERPENEGKKSFWVRVGAAFLNRDGSFTVKLDALPVNGVLQVRDWPVRDDWRSREGSAQPSANGNGAAGDHSHADIFAGA